MYKQEDLFAHDHAIIGQMFDNFRTLRFIINGHAH